MSSDISPPPTPKTEMLPNEKGRFTCSGIGPPCEWADKYRPGGFHPVNLGDTFRDGMYTVIRKLGYGSSSTVWLAIDSKNKRYVAIKVVDASLTSHAENELKIIRFLSEKAGDDPRLQYFITPRDIFVQEGPNGKHMCIVYEPMGPSAATMVEELPSRSPFPVRKPSNKLSDDDLNTWRTRQYPKWMAKKTLLHTLHALAFLHEHNIVHGNVHPGNSLFSISDINGIEVDELKHDETVIPRTVWPLKRRDGKTDKWAPKNLYVCQPLSKYVLLGPDMKVKTSDLDSGFWTDNPPTTPNVPVALRAPELILEQPFDMSIDIWAFGCLIFEYLIGRPLFIILPFLKEDEKEDDHLVQLNDVIGQLPDNIMEAWPRAKEWYDPVTRQPLHTYEEDDDGEMVPCTYDSLEVLFAQNKPLDVDEAESAVICSLIRQILVYSQEERPSAEELLKHPWFSK
ncbi:hypothetical protein Clacol_009613 [Clathrus columnatus]|uniref:Protein kinase domain-containing protein n=1 Tax=Clathrus columnatus TaxID=1419009 RepID=A0AAV5ANG7_9AGAM|nr:hypothetical protein Clacol_009613 [Clathrus columnatus]